MVTLTNRLYQDIKFQDSRRINPGHYPWLRQGRECVECGVRKRAELGSVFCLVT